MASSRAAGHPSPPPLLRQVRDDVAAGVAAAEEQECDVPVGTMQDQRPVEREVGQLQLQAADLREVLLLLP